MRILVDVIDALRVELGRATATPVHLVVLRHQEFGKIRAVLSGDACDECSFSHDSCGLALRRCKAPQNTNATVMQPVKKAVPITINARCGLDLRFGISARSMILNANSGLPRAIMSFCISVSI